MDKDLNVQIVSQLKRKVVELQMHTEAIILCTLPGSKSLRTNWELFLSKHAKALDCVVVVIKGWMEHNPSPY